MLHKFHPENKFQVQVYCGRLNWMAIIYIYICYFFCSLLLYFDLANKVCSVLCSVCQHMLRICISKCPKDVLASGGWRVLPTLPNTQPEAFSGQRQGWMTLNKHLFHNTYGSEVCALSFGCDSVIHRRIQLFYIFQSIMCCTVGALQILCYSLRLPKINLFIAHLF